MCRLLADDPLFQGIRDTRAGKRAIRRYMCPAKWLPRGYPQSAENPNRTVITTINNGQTNNPNARRSSKSNPLANLSIRPICIKLYHQSQSRLDLSFIRESPPRQKVTPPPVLPPTPHA